MALSKQDLAVLKVALRMEAAQFRKESKKIREDVKDLDKGFKGFGNTLKGFVAGALTIGTLTKAVNELRQTLEQTEAIGRFAERLGLTVEFMSALEYHFTSGGASADQFRMAMQRLMRKIGDANRNIKEAQAGFEGIELSWQSLGRMDPQEAALLVLRTIGEMENRQKRLSATVKLMDSEAASLTDSLDSLAPSVEGVIGAASRAGAVIDSELVETSKEVSQAIQDMGVAWENLKRDFLMEAKDDIMGLVEGLQDLLDTLQDLTWMFKLFMGSVLQMNKQLRRLGFGLAGGYEAEQAQRAAQEILDARRAELEEQEKLNKAAADHLKITAEEQAILDRYQTMGRARTSQVQTAGAVARSTAAGFSAEQQGFRTQQQRLVMDKERNELLRGMTIELQKLGRERAITIGI